MRRVLVTGATGFVGGELVPRLLNEGCDVVCLVRGPDRVDEPWRDDVQLVDGDATDDQAVFRAAMGCDTAYYLLHAMGDTSADLVEREERMAAGFAEAAELAGVEQIVYLGGLIDENALPTLSDHLYARYRTGQVLAAGPVPVAEIRAGVVLGAGSASWELLRAAAAVPVTVDSPWQHRRIQCVAYQDLLDALVAAGQQRAEGVLEIGTPGAVTYGELVEMVRDELGRQPAPALPARWLLPEATAPAASLLSGVDPRLTVQLLASLKHDAVITGDNALPSLGVDPTPLREIIRGLVQRPAAA